MTTTFKQDHDALKLILRDYIQLLRAGDVTAMPEISRRRIALSQSLRDHMGREDMATLALRKGPVAEQAEPFVRDHSRGAVTFFLHYTDHLKFWTTAQIAKDMPGYCKAVIALREELLERMDWEERHLHPLLGDSARKVA